MPWSIQDYKSNPKANAAINGVNVSDTSMPGDLNNAMRQMMADVAASALRDYALFISADADNNLTLGDDERLWSDPEKVAGGTPMLLISRDEGNKMSRGTDGKLAVVLADLLAIPWNEVTKKPSTFPPVPHAPSHGQNGADPIPTFMPSGAIALWWGDQGGIPDGWILCNGTGGAPDLREKFIYGAGGTVLPNGTGGYASPNVSVNTGQGTVTGQDSHAHQITGTTQPVTQASAPGKNLTWQLGYAPAGIIQMRTIDGTLTATHRHPLTIAADARPPYMALHYIMKT